MKVSPKPEIRGTGAGRSSGRRHLATSPHFGTAPGSLRIWMSQIPFQPHRQRERSWLERRIKLPRTAARLSVGGWVGGWVGGSVRSGSKSPMSSRRWSSSLASSMRRKSPCAPSSEKRMSSSKSSARRFRKGSSPSQERPRERTKLSSFETALRYGPRRVRTSFALSPAIFDPSTISESLATTAFQSLMLSHVKSRVRIHRS